MTSDQATSQPPNKQQAESGSFVLPSPFRVSLTMLSDWHVGTGAGRPGSIDKLVARDADGFPFVPAKTLNGIWRDALERLTLGLDGGDAAGAWSKWVEKIFGLQPNQIKAKELSARLANHESTYSFSPLSVQPARLSASLRAQIAQAVNALPAAEQERQRQKLLAALTFIKPGVAIDGDSGTAVTDYLRFEEMGRAGTVLEAECRLARSDETVSALLLLSAKLVERVGGKRRRGAGLCELKIEGRDDADVARAIEHLRRVTQTRQSGAQEEKRAEESDGDHASGTRSIIRENAATGEPAPGERRDAQASGWQTLDLTLDLRLPVAIVTATLGNVAEALDFIPGTYLLPHITKVLRTELGDEVFPAVAYGELLALPATPEVNGARGLPVPKAIYYDKLGGGFDKQKEGRPTVYNLFREQDLIEKGDEQKKGYRSGYVEALTSVAAGADKLPTYKTTSKTLLMHNTVEDHVQCPTEEVGGVYSREAIPTGTRLRSELRLTKRLADKLGADWWQDLSGLVRLGTSRKDDYGLAELTVSAPKDFPSSATPKGDRLTVCLLSDCLLRDSHLRQSNLAVELAKELSDKLKVTLEPIKSSAQETTALLLPRRIESWHEGWGFPRPTLMAIEAGSCAVLKIKDFASLTEEERDALEKSLREVEAAGIGERRGEGYGQVRFNPPLLTGTINSWAAATSSEETEALKPEETAPLTNDAPNGLLSDAERRFAELIEEAAWREELKVAVLKVAASGAERKKIFGFDSETEKPPMSQVGGLRSAFSRLRSRADAGIVLDWLDHLQGTKNRRERWAEDKETAEAKIKRIGELIKQENNVWATLRAAQTGEAAAWQAPPPIVRTVQELQDKFWAEAVRALFDACARAHKRELERKGAK